MAAASGATIGAKFARCAAIGSGCRHCRRRDRKSATCCPARPPNRSRREGSPSDWTIVRVVRQPWRFLLESAASENSGSGSIRIGGGWRRWGIVTRGSENIQRRSGNRRARWARASTTNGATSRYDGRPFPLRCGSSRRAARGGPGATRPPLPPTARITGVDSVSRNHGTHLLLAMAARPRRMDRRTRRDRSARTGRKARGAADCGASGRNARGAAGGGASGRADAGRQPRRWQDRVRGLRGLSPRKRGRSPGRYLSRSWRGSTRGVTYRQIADTRDGRRTRTRSCVRSRRL